MNFSTTPSTYKKTKAASVRKAKQSARDSDDPDESVEDVVNLDEIFDKTRSRMEKGVDWAKAQVYEGVERGRGRVTPALLDSVKVTQPGDGAMVPLSRVASITTKGNALMVEVWEHGLTKDVEAAIHQANLPGISPQRLEHGTIKVPVARPTHDQRSQILKQLAQTIESAKNQVRQARTEGMKSIGRRGEDGSVKVQKLADEFGGVLDDLIGQARREFEKV